MLEITQEQYDKWRNAIYCAQFGDSRPLKDFSASYPDLYRHMTSMLNKRTKICKILQAFMSVCPFIYWGALTFNEEEDAKDLKTKRKQVQRFLDKYFKLYVYVEENGEENERWHIHFLGVLKSDISYQDLYDNWHSRAECECLYKYYEIKKKIKYITKYVVKQVPRIHMNKRAILLCKDYKVHKHLKNVGFNCFNMDYTSQIWDLLELPF